MQTFIKWTAAFVIVVLVSTNSLLAATGGKIAGTVTDAESGDLLPGVNIIVEGTSQGAASDQDGQYNILNVSPGTYTLVFRMIGYATLRVQEVRVSVDLTTRIDAELESQVISGQSVTITAERKVVQRDRTSSVSSVSTDEMENLPIQSIDDVIELQAGVIRDGGNFHIRGGRANEVSFLVDGVNVTDAYSSEEGGVRVEKDAVQEVQLVSGTFNAEYGQAMSGIVKIITKEGGSSYKGKISSYVGDYITNRNVYSVLSRVDTSVNPESGEVTPIGHYANPLKGFNPTFNTDASLSGPVPFSNDKLTFFLNGRYVSRTGYLYGRNWYTPQGIYGDSSLVPMNSGYDYTGLGKLTYKFPSAKLSYQYIQNKSHDDRGYSRGFKYVPEGVSPSNSLSRTHLMSMTYTASEKTFLDLRVSRLDRETNSYLYDDPTQRPHWMYRYAGELYDTQTPAGAALLDSLKQNNLTNRVRYVVDPNNAAGYVHPDSTNTSAPYSFQNAGTQLGRNNRTYGFWDAKLDFTSQITQAHKIQSGIEFKRHELTLDNYTLIPLRIETAGGGSEEVVPFVPDVPGVESLSRDNYSRQPWEFSAYLQDKIELQDIIMNVGVRFDLFDANASKPTDPTDPDIYNPFKNNHIYKDYVAPPDSIAENPILMENYLNQFEKYTPSERKAFMRTKVDPKMQISPRLGISFPITANGVLHFSYGHFLAMPSLQYLYNNAEFKLQSGGGNRLLGNPDLKPEQTVQYEFGLQQALTKDLGLDVTLFYKDTRGWVGASPLIRTVRPSVSYSQYENKEYSQVKGITVDLNKRLADAWLARVYYSYQSAEGTYSNPDDAYQAIQDEEEPRRTLIPMGWDQRHTLNVYLTYSVRDWTATVTGQYRTGRPYTPEISISETVGGSAASGWRTNSGRLPTITGVDLRIMKVFRLGNDMQLRLYSMIYNVFDQAGEENVYADTGTASYSANIKTNYAGYNPDRVGTIEDYVHRPDWYQAPREIQIGMAIQF